ncbi:MAG: hypothetical protein ULS35scaffold63_28 [Phage 33_17]|nr:MAG: hypothetical protein ULS35scaffold63_28 [Phage 33_17]
MADLLSMWKDYSPSPNQPNIANSYLNAYQAGQNIRGKELEQQAFLEEQQRQRNLQQQIQNSGQKAAGGDLASLTQYALVNPQGVPALINALQYRQETQGQMANHVINLPLSQRPEAYKMYLQSLAEQGTDISQMPRDYSDKVYNGLLATRNNSRKINDVLNDQKRQFQEQLLQAQIQSQQVGQQLDQARINSEYARQAKYGAEINKLNMQGTANDPALTRKIDTNIINSARENAVQADENIDLLNQAEDLLNQGLKTGKFNANFAKYAQNIPGVATQRIAGIQEFEAISNELTIRIANSIKGSAIDSHITLAAGTKPSSDKSPEANMRIIRNKKALLETISEKPSFINEWINNYGSTLNSDERGRTFDKAWKQQSKEIYHQKGGTIEKEHRQKTSLKRGWID